MSERALMLLKQREQMSNELLQTHSALQLGKLFPYGTFDGGASFILIPAEICSESQLLTHTITNSK